MYFSPVDFVLFFFLVVRVDKKLKSLTLTLFLLPGCLETLSGRHCAEEGIVGLWRRKLQPADSPKLSRAFFEIVAIFPFLEIVIFLH